MKLDRGQLRRVEQVAPYGIVPQGREGLLWAAFMAPDLSNEPDSGLGLDLLAAVEFDGTDGVQLVPVSELRFLGQGETKPCPPASERRCKRCDMGLLNSRALCGSCVRKLSEQFLYNLSQGESSTDLLNRLGQSLGFKAAEQVKRCAMETASPDNCG